MDLIPKAVFADKTIGSCEECAYVLLIVTSMIWKVHSRKITAAEKFFMKAFLRAREGGIFA